MPPQEIPWVERDPGRSFELNRSKPFTKPPLPPWLLACILTGLKMLHLCNRVILESSTT